MRAIVVVYNLRRSEYTDPKIDAIEDAVKTAFSEMAPDFGVPAGIDPIFSFPFDPSVTSKKIPVAIVMEGFSPCPMEMEDRDEMAKRIANNFRAIPGNKGRKIGVIVKRSHESDGEYYSGRE